MKSPVIVAPGGSYAKAVVACVYGADEVYVGVPFTSLRMRQNKISSFDELQKTVEAIHSYGKKALLTMNIFPRNQDIKIFEQVVKQIKDVKADAIIFSDPGTFAILQKHFPKTPLHLSTQTSTMNRQAVKFRYDLGVKRIVLARELHIDEIKEIKKHVPKVELEVFVHGAMCMSYSGRCLLGDYMSGRPGNKGECSHACRFTYKVRLEEERRPGKLFQLKGDENGSHILSSKDLCTIEKLGEILPYVDAIKIEGRSKSEFYVAAIVKAYTHMRDSLVAEQPIDEKIINLVNVVPHRTYWDGFLFHPLHKYPEGEDSNIEIGGENIRSDEIFSCSKSDESVLETNIAHDVKQVSNDELTYEIIGIAMKIHDQLGPALLEKVYKKGFVHELNKRGYNVKEEQRVEYKIDDTTVGTGYIDLVINNTIAIELKSTKIIKGDYFKQLRSYMKNAPKITTGLILNFYNKKLGIKRLESDHPKSTESSHLTSSGQAHQTSITYDSAGPLFNRNYFGVFTDNFIEKHKKKYFEIDPKEVIEPGMKIKYFSATKIGELKIVDIIDAKGKQLEKVHCNTGNVYVLTDKTLQGWELLYE